MVVVVVFPLTSVLTVLKHLSLTSTFLLSGYLILSVELVLLEEPPVVTVVLEMVQEHVLSFEQEANERIATAVRIRLIFFIIH